MDRRCIIWSLLQVLGAALATISPWFLFINAYIAPAFRYGSWKSFSVLLFDFTFNTDDGGLHMAGGPIIHLIFLPVMLMEIIMEKTNVNRSD